MVKMIKVKNINITSSKYFSWFPKSFQPIPTIYCPAQFLTNSLDIAIAANKKESHDHFPISPE